MAAELPLPKQVFAHGWILVEDNKMSKSRGNVVRPSPIADVAGTDALRYFLMREITFGQDGSFSYDALIQRYNADLANGLGNLASRTLAMIHQYRGGVIPDSPGLGDIAETARSTTEKALECFNAFDFSRGLEAIWALIAVIDKFIVERAPWALAKAKNENAPAILDETLYTAAETIRIVCVLLYPVMPEATKKIWAQLGMTQPLEGQRVADLHWGKLPAGQKIGKVEAVFPRIEAQPAIDKMKELEIKEKARQDLLLGKKPVEEAPAAAANTISIDDFGKVDLRVGQVISAEKVKGSDKLLHMKVDIGEPRRAPSSLALRNRISPSRWLDAKW